MEMKVGYISGYGTVLDAHHHYCTQFTLDAIIANYGVVR